MNNQEDKVLLSLICAQLSWYKLESIAKQLADQAKIALPTPSHKLADLVQGENEAIQVTNRRDDDDDDILMTNLTIEPNCKPSPILTFQTWFTTQHREAVRCAAFSPDGKYIATGSLDNSIKVLDVARIKECFLERNDVKPVLKTIYDHTATVNQVQFHPNGIVLASCSDDGMIKLFDLVKPSARKSFRYFQDQFAVKSISFHPSGDFLLSGTEHSSPRIYDIHSLQCFIPTTTPSSHTGQINCVRYSPNGITFATASADGAIKIWDAVNGKVLNTIKDAHNAPVTSIRFSRNANGCGRLWDLGTGRKAVSYFGSTKLAGRATLEFSQTEDYIFGGDENSNALVLWDTRTGAVLNKFNAHQGPIVYVATSDRDNAVITCSEDARGRIWMI